jgi:hypothetical protein
MMSSAQNKKDPTFESTDYYFLPTHPKPLLAAQLYLKPGESTKARPETSPNGFLNRK